MGDMAELYDEMYEDGIDEEESLTHCMYCGQKCYWWNGKLMQYSTEQLHLCKRNGRVADASEFPCE